MTTTTATFIHKTKNQHIRTYMPDYVAETLKIKNGDKIDWKIEARGRRNSSRLAQSSLLVLD